MHMHTAYISSRPQSKSGLTRADRPTFADRGYIYFSSPSDSRHQSTHISNLVHTSAMNFSTSLLQLLGLSFAPAFVTPQGLNVTAISATNGTSNLECWSLSSAPRNARGAANYDIGNFEGAFVGVIPPKTYIGYALAPSIQSVSFPLPKTDITKTSQLSREETKQSPKH